MSSGNTPELIYKAHMKKFKLAFFASLLLTLCFDLAFAGGFPRGPHLALTPGKICSRGNAAQIRYPEKIAYCARDVSYDTKENIIDMYDEKLGYSIAHMTREDFKIDHFIPLCAGGSNDVSNLWPQHKSIYLITDPLEPLICTKMAEGKLRQKDAIALIIEAKTNIEKTDAIIMKVMSLNNRIPGL